MPARACSFLSSFLVAFITFPRIVMPSWEESLNLFLGSPNFCSFLFHSSCATTPTERFVSDSFLFFPMVFVGTNSVLEWARAPFLIFPLLGRKLGVHVFVLVPLQISPLFYPSPVFVIIFPGEQRTMERIRPISPLRFFFFCSLGFFSPFCFSLPFFFTFFISFLFVLCFLSSFFFVLSVRLVDCWFHFPSILPHSLFPARASGPQSVLNQPFFFFFSLCCSKNFSSPHLWWWKPLFFSESPDFLKVQAYGFVMFQV